MVSPLVMDASTEAFVQVPHVRRLRVGDEIVLKEKKTGKQRRITVNAEIVDAVGRLMAFRLADNRELQDEEPLFVGQRGVVTVEVIESGSITDVGNRMRMQLIGC